MADELQPGAAIFWHHEMRDGYGYVLNIPGRLLAIKGDRAKIEVRKKDGQAVTRWVKLANVTRA